MGNKVFVGNLPFATTNDELKGLFEAFGEISEAQLIINKFSGRSKGFGFVTFVSEESAAKAITEMNDKEIGGRKIVVSEAKPFNPEERPERPRRSFGASRRSFGDRDGGYGGGRRERY